MAIFKIDIVYVGIFIFPVLRQCINSLSLFCIHDYTLSVISNPVKSEKMAERLLTEQFELLNPFSESVAATKKLRIASWNVNGLTIKKSEKVSEEERIQNIKNVAEAIKLNKFVIVALQEISSDAAMVRLREELNKDCPLQSWRCTSQPVRRLDLKKLGFVWNSGVIKYEEEKDLLPDYFERTPFNLTFKFEDIITINLVNLHLIHRGNRLKKSTEISKKI